MNVGPYDVYLHEKVLFNTPRSGQSRQRIMHFISSLAVDPFQKGDYEDSNSFGICDRSETHRAIRRDVLR